MLKNVKNAEDSVLFFLKQNKKCVMLLAVFTVLFSLQKVTVYNIGYDTDEFLVNPSGTFYHWLAIDRYTLVLLKNIFPFLNGNLYVLNILTYINFFLFALTFLYFLNMDVRDNDWKKNSACGALLISSPIFLEQFYFTLQSAEFSFALFVMAFCFVLTYKLLRTKKISILFWLIPLLVFCYGIYQAFLNLYIAGALICLYKLNEEKGTQNIKRISVVAGIWIISSIIYISISTFVKYAANISESEYLADKVRWLSTPFFEVCFMVVSMLGRVFLGRGHVLNLSYAICFAFLICYFIKLKHKVSWRVFLLLCLLVSPFLLNIATGSDLLIRSLITLPVFCVFVYFEFYQSNRQAKYIICLVLISQIINSQALLYADNVRYENDLTVSKKIYQDCGADKNTPIVFVGIERTEENVFSIKGQVMGCSFFEWGNGGNVDEMRIYCLMKCNQMPFALPTEEQVEYTDNIKSDAEYPNEGYVVEYNGCYYVNLGE